MNFLKMKTLLRDLLGEDAVIDSREPLRKAESATFSTSQQIPCIVRPKNTEQVRTVMRAANESSLRIYPVSVGRNWGLGSRVPVEEDCILLDLSGMNRILDYDEKLAYVTIEPGVTVRQLYSFLRERKSRLMVALTGSTPDSSLVGNVMERGHAKGPYGDRFGFVAAMEVVTPTGELIHTGFDRFSGARSAPVARWGVGPALDGLFTQSNLGIVTRLTLWLQPAPELFQAVYFSIRDRSRLGSLVDQLRTLRLRGVLRSSVSLLNDFRVQSELGQFPWKMTSETPLPPSVLQELKKTRRGPDAWQGEWNGESATYALSAEQARVEGSLIESTLRSHVNELQFVQETRESLEALVNERWNAQEQRVDPAGLPYLKSKLLGFAGVPLTGSIPIAYWRKKMPIPQDMDLDRDRCGIIWCSPTIPANGEDVRETVDLINETMLESGFEPNLCLNYVTDRSIDVTAAILFDRDQPGEDEKAIQCYNRMLKRAVARGYYPYRLTIHSMNHLPQERDDFGSVLSRLKGALDPNHVLSPGRYGR